MLFLLFTFGGVFIVLLGVGALIFRGADVQKRLMEVIRPSALPATTVPGFSISDPSTSFQAIVRPFQRVIPRSEQEISVVRKRLVRAGYRQDSHLNYFYGAKAVVPLVLCLIATLLGAYHSSFFFYIVALGLGYLAPDFWLGHLIKKRQTKMRLGLPDLIDLMVVCIEAGLSIDMAVVRTTEELGLTQPELCEEMTLVTLEQRAGRPRADAWRTLAERTDVESIRTLAAALVQADQFGTSITRALRAHSESLRTQRRQQVEEQAAKTTVKLVFPLVLFIFPSLFLVTMGPSMIIIMQSFKKMFG